MMAIDTFILLLPLKFINKQANTTPAYFLILVGGIAESCCCFLLSHTHEHAITYSFKNSSTSVTVSSGNLLPFFAVQTSPINEPCTPGNITNCAWGIN